MKKATILTLIGANNVGTVLQAIALKHVVQQLGYEVTFSRAPSTNNRSSRLSNILRYVKQGNYVKLAYKAVSTKKYAIIKSKLPITAWNADEKTDLCIIGSDEVWNLKSASFASSSCYFAKGIQADRIISYAACAANSDKACLESKQVDFKGFDHISVRDQKTCDLVYNVTGQKPPIVVDPTLLVDSLDQFAEPIEEKREFILVYSYGLEKSEIKAVKRFAKEKKLPLFSVGTYNHWCDKNIIVSPYEFLSYLKKAKYVVTSTFHGTVLSVRYNKPVAVFAHNNHKTQYFLKQMGLENIDVCRTENLKAVLLDAVDYQRVNMVIEELRYESMRFLHEALQDYEKEYGCQ